MLNYPANLWRSFSVWTSQRGLRLWSGLLCGACLLAFPISLHTNTPTGWQAGFWLIMVILLGLGLYLSIGISPVALKSRLIAWRQRELSLFLIIFTLLVATFFSSIALLYFYLTYIAIVPLMIGGALYGLFLFGSSTRPLEVAEILAKSSMIVFSLVIASLLFDFGLSIYYRNKAYWEDNSVTEFDEDFGWRVRPDLNLRSGEYISNSLGQRDAPEPDAIPEDTIVLGVQGDSQIEGIGVNTGETFTAYLQTCLDEWNGLDRPIVLINFGVRGYDINHYLQQIEKSGPTYGVAGWVMVFNTANDYGHSMLDAPYGFYRPYYQYEGETLRLMDAPTVPFVRQEYPSYFTPPFAAYNTKLKASAYERFSIDRENPLSWSWTYLMFSRKFYGWRVEAPTQQEQDEMLFYLRGYWQYAPIEAPFSDYQATFDAIMEAWLQGDQFRQIFILPGRDSVLSHESINTAEAILERLGKGQADTDSFLDWITARLTELAPQTSSFYEVLTDHPDPISQFIPNDSHLNAEGYQRVAESACEQMKPHLLETYANH